MSNDNGKDSGLKKQTGLGTAKPTMTPGGKLPTPSKALRTGERSKK